MIYARIYTAGLIEITNNAPVKIKGFNESGDLKSYRIESADTLFKVCSRVDEVKRPSGKIEKGKTYTQKKAENDFKSLMF